MPQPLVPTPDAQEEAMPALRTTTPLTILSLGPQYLFCIHRLPLPYPPDLNSGNSYICPTPGQEINVRRETLQGTGPLGVSKEGHVPRGLQNVEDLPPCVPTHWLRLEPPIQ
jgi:hypothetical protein